MKEKSSFLKKHSVVIFLSVLIVALGGIIASMAINGNKQQPVNQVSSSVNHEFEDTQSRAINSAGTTAGIKVPGFSAITIDADKKDAEVNFFNPEENNVYFQISLMIDGEETPFFKSKLLKPGQHLYNITLDKTFSKGEYDMVIIYESFSMDDKYTPKNGAKVNCKLKVV